MFIGKNAYGCVKQLFLLKQRHRNFKVLLSIGGWTYFSKFAIPASSAEIRQRFASTAVRLAQDYGFDGIDVDWEYLADAQEANNLKLLLAELKQEFSKYANGDNILLSVACPAGPDHYKKLDVAGMIPYVDIWNLMAYDYAGSFSKVAAHQSNLFYSSSEPNSTPFNTNQAVQFYLAVGVPPERLTLGMPLYGRSFIGTSGLGGSFSGVRPGQWEEGVWDFKSLT